MTTTNGSDMLPEATFLSADDMSCKISQTAPSDDCASVEDETNSKDKINIAQSKIPTHGSCMSVDVVPMSTDDAANKKSKTATSDDCASVDDDETNSNEKISVAQSRISTDYSSLSTKVVPMDAATSNQKKVARNFNALVSSFTSEEGTPFTNGYAYNIYASLGKKQSKAAEFLVTKLNAKGYVYGPKSIRNVLMRFIKTIESHKKALGRNWLWITSYLNEMFRLPQMKEKKPSLAATNEPTPLGVNGESQESNAAMEPDIQLKTDCKKCPAIRRSYRTAIKELKEKLRASKQTIREMSKRFNVKRLNQDMKRKAAVRAKLRQKIQDLKKENFSLKKAVENLKKNDYRAMVRAEKRKRKRAELQLTKTILKNKDLKKENQLNNQKIIELDYEVDCLRTDENSS